MATTEGRLDQESSTPQTLLVYVVSPSTEVTNKLTFPEVPTTTTISAMKRRIQDAVATRPTPERQRLIYRGMALVQQDLTLGKLFGVEAVRRSTF